MPDHICPNCNNHFSGNYCNHCGQKLAHRITLGHIGHELAHAFTHTDKGFFHLMIELFRKPGQVAREYIIENKRKRYGTPFQYILIIGAVATFVVVNTHFMESTMEAVGMTPGANNDSKKQIMQKVNEFQSKYYNFMILLQLPFLSLAGLWVYKKYKLNYAEQLTLHTFITAQTTLISMILMLLLFVLDRSNVNIMRSFALLVSLASIVYHIGVYMQFFREKSFLGFLKATGAYLLGILIFFISVTVISLLVGYVYVALTKS